MSPRVHTLLLLALFTVSARAQEGPPEPAEEVRAVPLRELGAGRAELLRARLERGAGCFDEASWRERLLQPDLDLRELAFDELVGELPRCAQGQRILQTWAVSTEPQLAWTARLALRELERLPETGWKQVSDLAPSLGTPPSEGAVESLDPGLDLRRFPGLPDGMFAYGGGLSLHRPRAFSLPSTRCEVRDGRAYCVRMGEEGVTVEIVDGVSGTESRRTFAGGSLEEILGAHPEVAREVPEIADWVARRGEDGAMSLRWTDNRVRLLLDPGERAQQPPSALLLDGVLVFGGPAPAHDFLGVECEPLEPERARELGIDPPRGLVVERTWPGSIATRIELRRGDVLLELNGKALRSGVDLRQAFGETGPGDRVVVRFVDRDGQVRTLTWEPEGEN